MFRSCQIRERNISHLPLKVPCCSDIFLFLYSTISHKLLRVSTEIRHADFLKWNTSICPEKAYSPNSFTDNLLFQIRINKSLKLSLLWLMLQHKIWPLASRWGEYSSKGNHSSSAPKSQSHQGYLSPTHKEGEYSNASLFPLFSFSWTVLWLFIRLPSLENFYYCYKLCSWSGFSNPFMPDVWLSSSTV